MNEKNFISMILVIMLVFCGLNSGFAQDVEITTTNLAILDKKLEISYEYVKSKKKHRFDVWVEITSISGKIINARTLSGDIGDGLAGGKDKKIIWDYNADGIVLNEEINVKVKAIVSTVLGAVNTGKVLMQSAVLPGWGLSTMESGKPFWLIGVAGYAALSGSIYLKSAYKKSYDDYLSSSDEEERSDLLSKSRSQQSLSRTLSITAIGIWATGIVWTALKANKKNSSLSAMNKNQKIQFYGNYNPKLKTSGFTMKYNF